MEWAMVRGGAFIIVAALGLVDSAAAGTTEDLTAIEHQRSAAIAAHDTAYLDKLYADDFSGVTATGYSVDKLALLTVFSRDNPAVFALDDIKVRPLGDVAVVTGRLIGRDKNNRIVFQSRYMHVYARRDGSWQIVAGEGTALPLAN
jgi:ketosteroid isomerase-like protein